MSRGVRMSGVLNAVRMARRMTVSVTGRVTMTVTVRRATGVSPMPETAECHRGEAGGTKQEARDVEIHRR